MTIKWRKFYVGSLKSLVKGGGSRFWLHWTGDRKEEFISWGSDLKLTLEMSNRELTKNWKKNAYENGKRH